MLSFLDRYLVPEWRFAHYLWSLRLELVGMLLSGLWMALPAFQEMVPPIEFLGISMGLALVRGSMRLISQPKVKSWLSTAASLPQSSPSSSHS